MSKIIKCGTRSGSVLLPASKSVAHRFLICAALSNNENNLFIKGISSDIKATSLCLNALFGNMKFTDNGVFAAAPYANTDNGEQVMLPCGESGTTLRLILPLVGAAGKNAVFDMQGRLPQRPITELALVLKEKGMNIEQKGNKLYCGGRLTAGDYVIPGDVSSQYISALLFALPLLSGDSTITITKQIESAGYITLTEQALTLSGIDFKKQGNRYFIKGNQQYNFPSEYSVEADWSGAAAALCMGAFSKEGITVSRLDLNSVQGDKEIIDILKNIGAFIYENNGEITVKRKNLCPVRVDASNIPDTVPTLAALLAAVPGKSEIYNAARLRLKESDRLYTTATMLKNLGADVSETADGLIIEGKVTLGGGKTEVFSDHRIAMAAAVAASACSMNVIIDNKDCVQKSYTDFWADLEQLRIEK